MLLPGNSIPAPGEEQCRCSRTSPGERLQAALLFIFFSIVSYVCTEFWVLHRREPGPALDWVPGACGIPVCVGPALLACRSLSSSFFPRNKTSSFLQPIRLLVLRKQERWLLMSKRCRTQPFGSAGAAKPGMRKRKEKGSRGWGWSSLHSDSATALGFGSACMWGIRPGTGGAEQPQPGTEIEFMRHFKAFPSYLPAARRRPMAAPPALAEDRSDCCRGAAPPRSPRGRMARAARLWLRAGAPRGPPGTLAAPSRGRRSRPSAARTIPALGRRMRGCGRRRSAPSPGCTALLRAAPGWTWGHSGARPGRTA